MPRTLNDQARTEVKAVIDGFVGRNEVFTSAHVTMALRAQRMWAGTYSHTDGIAPEVRDIFYRNEMTGYEQSMVGRFFAYHPQGVDPSTVDLRISGANWLPRVDIGSVSAPAPTSASHPASSPSRQAARASVPASDGNLATFGVESKVAYNSEGYAQIPASVLRLVDLKGGDGIVLEGTPLAGTVSLRKARDGEAPVARCQPANGALRIRDRVLMPYGVGMDDEVLVTPNPDRTLTLR